MSSFFPQFSGRLKVIHSVVAPLRGREYTLSGQEAWIGRGPDCDLVINDNNISRRHARFAAGLNGTLEIHDNQSSNGILFEGQKVHTAKVQPGQQFTLGATTFEWLAEIQRAPRRPGGFSSTRIITGIADIAEQIYNPKPLLDQGKRVEMVSHRPIPLTDPNSMWIVTSEQVEIFAVNTESGTRRHFFTIETGQAFFGIDTERFGFESKFIADVSKDGVTLKHFTLDQLQLLLANIPTHRESMTRLLTTWVTTLSRRLTREVDDRPQLQILLRGNEESTIEHGQIFSTEAPLLWTVMPSGPFLFDDLTSISYEVEGLLFPIANSSWLELLGDRNIQLKPLRTEDCILDARLWAGVDVFYRIFCECAYLSEDFATANAFARLDKKDEQDEGARIAGIEAIESVLAGAETWQPRIATEIDALFGAAKQVGRHQQIEIKAHPYSRTEAGFEDQLLEIATASRVRVRKIKLGDGWWKKDQGPFLGRLEEDQTPVAVLPLGPNAYECINPQTQERQRVNEELALALSGFGHVFYSPLPSGSLRVRDVLTFATRGLKAEFRTVVFIALGLGIFSMATPFITGQVFDTAIPQAERKVLQQLTFGLLIVAFTTAAFQITQKIAVLRIQGKMDYSVQAALWDRLLNLPTHFFRAYSAGDLADRAAGVAKIRNIIAGAGVAAILGAFTSLFNAFQMAFYSVKLAVVGTFLSLSYVGLTFLFSYFQVLHQRDELAKKGRIQGLVLQLIQGIAKLRVSGAENYAFKVWATRFAEQQKASFKVGRWANHMAVLNAGFTLLATLVLFAFMAYFKQDAESQGQTFDLSTGEFLAFSAAFGLFQGAMQTLGDVSVNILKVIPTFERMKPIIESEPEIDESKRAPGQLQGTIKLSHVYFRYSPDSPWVLEDFSLDIGERDFIAIVGSSGSGKSTLLRLLLGFERPDKGMVAFDGMDLSELDPRMVRQQLGVVLQDSRVLPAEIYRNIVGASSRSVEEAWDAATQAGFDQDIRMMPMQMHTHVSEGGGGLSGGQRQRLMIARALVNKPKIILLDEATSALDNRTQAIVTESMNRLNVTRIVIAHRLSTVRDANRICYLEAGQIVEQGTYEELMSLNGKFAQMAKRQIS